MKNKYIEKLKNFFKMRKDFKKPVPYKVEGFIKSRKSLNHKIIFNFFIGREFAVFIVGGVLIFN